MSAAACDVWIWGNRVAELVETTQDLVLAGEVDRATKEGEAWIVKVNEVFADAADRLQTLVSALPS